MIWNCMLTSACCSLLRGNELLLLEPIAHLPLDAAVDQPVHVPLLAAGGGVHHATLVRQLGLVEAEGQGHLHRAARRLVVAVAAAEAELKLRPVGGLGPEEDRHPGVRELLQRGALALLVVLALLLQELLLTAHGGAARRGLELAAA